MTPGWEEALEVQADLLRQITGPHWREGMLGWLGNRAQKYGRNAMLPSAHAFSEATGIVGDAEPIYVTEEMHDLTLMAMETFDPKEKVHPEDFFIRSGMALLQRPFVAIDSEGFGVEWRCVTWRYIELPPEASPDAVPVPALEIILWADLHHRDGWDEAHPEIADVAFQLYSSWGWRWAVSHATLVPLDLMSQWEHMTNEGDPAASWMTFTRVLNKLMQERIVLKTRVTAPRAMRRRAERAGLEDIKDVVVCELRRPRDNSIDWPEGNGEAHYSHSFMVRGHWRWQACGPKHSLRKQKFIAGYVKGQGPFKDKKRVWVWDR